MPWLQQGPADGQQHADLAGPHTVTGRGRRTHPLQREDEQRAGDEIGDFDYDLTGGLASLFRRHLSAGPLALNIFSMRSVIRNPPTMLLVAAITAMPQGRPKAWSCARRLERSRRPRRSRPKRWSATSAECAAAAKPADHLKSNESRQHEYVERLVSELLPLPCVVRQITRNLCD